MNHDVGKSLVHLVHAQLIESLGLTSGPAEAVKQFPQGIRTQDLRKLEAYNVRQFLSQSPGSR